MVWLFIVIVISLNHPTTQDEGSVPAPNLEMRKQARGGGPHVLQPPARKWQSWESQGYKAHAVLWLVV